MGITTEVSRQISLNYWEIETTRTALTKHRRDTIRKSKPSIRKRVIGNIDSTLNKLGSKT